MYKEIFEDVQKVKDILEKAGIKDIPSVRIFNLLENLLSPDIVAQIFIESDEFNGLDSGGSGFDIDMSAISNNLKNFHNGIEVEVIKEIKNETKTQITVDLTKVPDKKVSNRAVNKEAKRDTFFLNELILEDTCEDSNQNDCSNDSDVDNYYTTSDYEEDEKTVKRETKSESPPPILSILKDLSENFILPEIPTQTPSHGIREVENFEILEENNNDPNNNNNLEEIQLEQTRPKSPIAGCSRDFTDQEPGKPVCEESDNSESKCVNKLLVNIEPQPSCSREYIYLEESDSEIEELDSSQVSSQINYEKLLEETESINRFFPDISGDVIFSMLDKYGKATNRVSIVLWELLPTDKPEPFFPKKRKKEDEFYPSNIKKSMTSISLSKIDEKTIKIIQEDVRNNGKLDIVETGSLRVSTNDTQMEKSSIKTGNFETKSNQQKETYGSSKDKSKQLRHVVNPPHFIYQSNLNPESQALMVKKNILSAPKLILHTANKNNDSQSTLKRKLTSPTKEISEEGFVSEDSEIVNATSNTVLLQNPLSTLSFKKVKNLKDEEMRNDTQPVVSSHKIPKCSEGLDVSRAIASSSNLSPLIDYDSSWSPISNPSDRSLTSNNTFCNGSEVGIKVLKDSSLHRVTSLSPTVQTIYPISIGPKLEFLKSNQENQFYQIPTVKLQTQKSDAMASTSSAGPLNLKTQLPHIPVPSRAAINVVQSIKSDEIPSKDTYYKLRSIFPDIDPDFIKEKCIDPPFDVKGLSMEQQLNMFVEVLLTDGSKHQVHEIREDLDDVGNKDEQYENLLGIFPEADPEYLRKFVDNNYKNSDNLKSFIQQNLENPSYPTRTQYLEKIKITQQIKECTTDFNIKTFLQIFPNPVVHFENPGRKCTYKPMANEFLKDVFRKHKVATISLIYRRRNHHLSLTAKDLSNITPDMKGKRSNILMPTEDIPLLQEMAYIKHKKDIVAYLEDVKRQELQDFKNLKERGMLLECQCCFNDECLPRQCSTCEDGHIFCHSCILKGTESKMGDGQNHITCFADCSREFSLSVLQEVLPPTSFSILLQKRQEAEVMAAGLEGLVSCPFCHFASIPPVESKVFKCLNPDCMKETCRLCKELNHVPLKCDEVLKEDEARLKLEEKMTEALVRICYKCKKPFFKEEGCNKMTCVCGASMCYLCSTPLANGDYKHFNGQGSTNLNLCPLWIDNRRMNAEAVRKMAEVTENELRKKNPNLKMNATSILPTLPPKTRGPHDDIPNANAWRNFY